jgi:hypothetical protein
MKATSRPNLLVFNGFKDSVLGWHKKYQKTEKMKKSSLDIPQSVKEYARMEQGFYTRKNHE